MKDTILKELIHIHVKAQYDTEVKRYKCKRHNALTMFEHQKIENDFKLIYHANSFSGKDTLENLANK